MNNDLFISILAMDSYNRGYDQRVTGLPVILNSTAIGNATILRQSDVLADTPGVNAGFYAIAYNWNGTNVISYRGTDNFNPLSPANDIWNGWTVGAGFVGASQAGVRPAA